MFTTIATLILALSLVLSGGGAAVAAAQTSLPDQALYPVKTIAEEVRVRLTSRKQARFDLALELASRRAEEIQAMLRGGQTPPEVIVTRFQDQVDSALRLAAQLPDEQIEPALLQIQAQLRDHQQLFAGLSAAGSPAQTALLSQTREMLRDRQQLCETGLQDPDLLRDQLRDRDRDRDRDRLQTPAPSGQPGAGNPWLAESATPGAQNGPGPRQNGGGAWNTGTATPGSGVGPGPGGSQPTSQPSDEIVNPPGTGQGNPWTTGTPTPGTGYGPGPGSGANQPTASCTPDPQHSAGPGPADGSGNPWATGTPTPNSGVGPGPGPQPETPAPPMPPENGGGAGPNTPTGTPPGQGGGGGGSHP